MGALAAVHMRLAQMGVLMDGHKAELMLEVGGRRAFGRQRLWQCAPGRRGHVKGHSGDGGNDRADVVQWGKEEGPYARLRALGAGEGDSRFGAAIRENSSLGSEKRVDSRGNGVLHRGL